MCAQVLETCVQGHMCWCVKLHSKSSTCTHVHMYVYVHMHACVCSYGASIDLGSNTAQPTPVASSTVWAPWSARWGRPLPQGPCSVSVVPECVQSAHQWHPPRTGSTQPAHWTSLHRQRERESVGVKFQIFLAYRFGGCKSL